MSSCLFIYCLLSCLLVALVYSQPDPFYTNDVTVNITQGQLKGFRVDYGSDRSQLYYGAGDVFLGIPFVQPPVGELRFQKPQPACPFTTTPYNATYYRPMCPQYGASNTSMSEDCLYLNVFSPNSNSNQKYPVFVWIHGGSMRSGTAKDFAYKGAIRNMVSNGIVVVTIQYRLGMLGFFTTYTDDFQPNMAMLDQVEALRWVRDNIANFGGDPYKVTLGGQSAGSASVSAHTYSPLSQELFQAAIMESGTVLTCFEGSLGFTNMSYARAKAICNTTESQWQSKDFTDMKKCLMAADYHSWLPMDDSLSEVMGWKMSQDNYFMPGVPADLAAKRPNIPILIGSMLNEFSLFDLSALQSGLPLSYYSKQGFQFEFNAFCSFMGGEENNIMAIMESVYVPPNTAANDSYAWLQVNDRVLTCAGFTGVIVQEVDHYVLNNNNQVYLYQMTYPPNVGKIDYPTPGWQPVPHAAEIPYVWLQSGPWDNAIKKNQTTPGDFQLLDWFSETWSNFIKYQFPRRDPHSWPSVKTTSNLDYYEINNVNNVMRQNYRLVDQTVWNQIVPILAGPLPPQSPFYPSNITTSNINSIRQQHNKFRLQSQCDVTPPISPTTTTTVTTVTTTTTTTTTSTFSPTSSRVLSTTVTNKHVTTQAKPVTQSHLEATTKVSSNIVYSFVVVAVYLLLC